jgi:hypothetical protein
LHVGDLPPCHQGPPENRAWRYLASVDQVLK